jgi:hypothetical protein
MGDSGDLVALLGHLDRAIGELEGDAAVTARAAAATMVPPLAEPGAPGWYDRLVAAMGVELEPRSVSEAMAAIASPAEGLSALPRRLVAITAVARALPRQFGPDGSEAHLTLQALSTPGILASAPPLGERMPPSEETRIVDEAPVLLARLVDPVELPNVDAYRQFIGRESNRALLQDALLRLPAPCTTDVVEVTAGGQAARALALVTTVCVTGVSLAEVAAQAGFLNPANWARSPAWCEMLADPANPADHKEPARYLEVVALDCPSGALEVAVWLDFSRLVQRPRALVRTYTMSANQAGGVPTGAGAAVQTANNAVVVDEGSLKVIDEGAHLQVKTTKRVRFRAGLDVDILRIISCGAGYGALAAEFVVAVTGGAAQDIACAPAALKTTPAAPAQADPVKEGVEAVGQSIDECATALKSSIVKAASGAYTTDDLTEDVRGAFARSTRAWTRVIDLAAAVARPPVEEVEVVSDSFELDPPGDPNPCTLALAGPLLAHAEVAPLPPDRVRFAPETLAAGGDGFALVVQPRGLRGTTYYGVALVRDVTTAVERQVNVDVQVP